MYHNTLYSEQELYEMSLEDLNQLIEASWVMLQAHKNYYQVSKQWTKGNIEIDYTLTDQWGALSQIYFKRLIGIQNVWKCVAIAVRENESDMREGFDRLFDAIGIAAKYSSFETLSSHDFWTLCDYVNDTIYAGSDTPRQDHAAFNKEFFRQKTNKSRVRVCLKWAQASYKFGVVDFKGSK